jgi:hypothetical protein
MSQYSVLDRVEFETLKDLIQDICTKDDVKPILKGADLLYSGTWDDYWSQIQKGLNEDDIDISVESLTRLLADKESYGTQHVRLFQLNGDDVQDLKDPGNFWEFIESLGWSRGKDYLVLEQPDDPTVSGVKYDSDYGFAIKWVERKTWWEREDRETDEESGRRIRTTREVERESRNVNVVWANFDQKAIEVRVNTLETGGRSAYKREFQKYENEIRSLVPLHERGLVEIRPVIEFLFQSDEVRNRQHDFKDASNNTTRVTSAGKDHDLSDGTAHDTISDNLSELSGDRASVYWKEEKANALNSDVQTSLYAPNEISFGRSLNRDEARYVLERIRKIYEQQL